MEWKLVFSYVLFMGYALHMTCAQSCTQKVLVEEGNGKSKKVTVIRKVPARCSNWDKAWVWLTGMDCKTKYVKEMVDFPSKTPVYRERKICCPHEEQCRKNYGTGIHLKSSNQDQETHTAGGLDENDEKFLAITFGSATAALVIILLIIVLSFCRKQQPRFIENFFNRRQRMYEEEIIGVEPSAPYLGDQCEYRYKNGNTRLIESEYEEIPDYHSKDKYPILENMSDSNEYIQEIALSERQTNRNQNDYTTDALLSLASGSNDVRTHETTRTEGDVYPSVDCNNDSYENTAAQFVPASREKVNENLSRNGSENLRLENLMQFSDSSTKNKTNDCCRKDSTDFSSPSKCSINSIPTDYIDFSNIVVPNCEQGDTSITTEKAQSYEKLDTSAREKDNLEQAYDALKVSTNENNTPNSQS